MKLEEPPLRKRSAMTTLVACFLICTSWLALPGAARGDAGGGPPIPFPGWWAEATRALAAMEGEQCSWEPLSLTDTFTGSQWTHWDYTSHAGGNWVGACPKIVPEASRPNPAYHYELICYGNYEEEHDSEPAGWSLKCEFEQKGDEGLPGSVPVDCSREEGSTYADTGWVQHGSAFDCGGLPSLIARLAPSSSDGGASSPGGSPSPAFSPKGVPSSLCNRLTACTAHTVFVKSIQTPEEASVVDQGWMKIALLAAPICAARYAIDAASMASTANALNAEASAVGTLSGDAGQDLYGMLLEEYVFGATPVCEMKTLGQVEPGINVFLSIFGVAGNLPIVQPLVGDGVMEQSTRAAFVWYLLATIGDSQSQGLLRIDYIQRSHAFDVCRVQAVAYLHGVIDAEARPLDIYYPAAFANCKNGFHQQTVPPQQATAGVFGGLVKVGFEASAPFTVITIPKRTAGQSKDRISSEASRSARPGSRSGGAPFKKGIRTVAGRHYELRFHVAGATSVRLQARASHKTSAPVVVRLEPHGGHG